MTPARFDYLVQRMKHIAIRYKAKRYIIKLRAWNALFPDRPSMRDWLLSGQADRRAAGGYRLHDNPKDAK